MSNRKRGICLVLFLAVLVVFGSARSLRAQCNCQDYCVTGFTQFQVDCSGPGCSGSIIIQAPEGGQFGSLHAACFCVACCTSYVPTWYWDGSYCA